jgi:hypothetical protein
MIDMDAIERRLPPQEIIAKGAPEALLRPLIAEVRRLRAIIADSRGWGRLVTDNAALRERLAAAERVESVLRDAIHMVRRNALLPVEVEHELDIAEQVLDEAQQGAGATVIGHDEPPDPYGGRDE